jgi:hypothetical protein
MVREETESAAHSNAVRPLTSKEIALCRSIFPDELPYAAVRLCDGPGSNLAAKKAFGRKNTAITLRRKIYFRVRYRADFTEGDERAQHLFVHEMTHVWQWHRLGVVRFLLRYARELLGCRGDANAMYKYDRGVTSFAKAMLEAQAQMAGDYRWVVITQDDEQKALIEKSLAGSGLFPA